MAIVVPVLVFGVCQRNSSTAGDIHSEAGTAS